MVGELGCWGELGVPSGWGHWTSQDPGKKLAGGPPTVWYGYGEVQAKEKQDWKQVAASGPGFFWSARTPQGGI